MTPSHFCLGYSLEPRPPAFAFDEEAMAGLAPIVVALARFAHEYFHAPLEVRAGEHVDKLELGPDLRDVLPRIPGWLRGLARDGRGVLSFSGQGSERDLIAERDGPVIAYRFRPFFTPQDAHEARRVVADDFIREWWTLADRAADALQRLVPAIVDDPEFQTFRRELSAAEPKPAG